MPLKSWNVLRLLLATTNHGKLREIRTALQGLSLETLSLSGIAAPPPPAESGKTFMENARLKARYYARSTGLPSLADDSGLCIDALGGAPGVKTARIADDDPGRIGWILQRLRGVENPVERGAHFACALCLYLSESRRIETEGRVEGRITQAPRGRHGFGQDPIFFHPSSGKTFAELTLEQKNRVSHRAQALRQLRAEIERHLEWLQ